MLTIPRHQDQVSGSRAQDNGGKAFQITLPTNTWEKKTRSTQRELQSLAGLLQHTTYSMPPPWSTPAAPSSDASTTCKPQCLNPTTTSTYQRGYVQTSPGGAPTWNNGTVCPSSLYMSHIHHPHHSNSNLMPLAAGEPEQSGNNIGSSCHREAGRKSNRTLQH